MQKKLFRNELAAAAHHEAGHAVMCYLMRLRIKSISIGDEGLDGGQVTHDNPLLAVSLGASRRRLQLEKTIMLCFAGPVAQEKYASSGPTGDYGGTIDTDMALTLAMRTFRSRKTATAYVNFVKTWVRQKLDDPRVWEAVERLARVLLQERKISGRQAEAVIRGRLGDFQERTIRGKAAAPIGRHLKRQKGLS